MNFKNKTAHHPAAYGSSGPFFSPSAYYASSNAVQRSGKGDKPASPVKTEVEVVSETDMKKGKTKVKGKTTRTAEEKLNKVLKTTVKEKTTGEDRKTTVGLKASAGKVKDGKAGASASVSAGLTAKETPDPAVADKLGFGAKIAGRWVPFDTSRFRLDTNAALSLSTFDGLEFNTSADFIILPANSFRPELGARIISDFRNYSAEGTAGLTYDISKQVGVGVRGGLGYSSEKGSYATGAFKVVISF